jgi:hypothetical protein
MAIIKSILDYLPSSFCKNFQSLQPEFFRLQLFFVSRVDSANEKTQAVSLEINWQNGTNF